MRMFLALIFLFNQSVSAFTFGTGMAPGMTCPYPYGPGQGAYNGRDEISNLHGNLGRNRQLIELQKRRIANLDRDIAAARGKVRKVIKRDSAWRDIERHYKYRANREDYSPDCGGGRLPKVEVRRAPNDVASAGGQSSNVVNFPTRGGHGGSGGGEDPGRYAVPNDYCYKGENGWAELVDDDGRMNEAVCDYEIPVRAGRPDEARIDDCRDGLADYYDLMAKRDDEMERLRALEKQERAYNDRRDDIERELTEGTYDCATGNCPRRGRSNMGAGSFAMMGIALLSAFMRPQPRPQPMLVAVPRGGAPGMLPMPGPGMPPFPGPLAYPGRPYAAPMPGFYGMHPGAGPGFRQYGAMPGGIGPGAFGCQGTHPNGLGNPLGPQFQPFLNGGPNPFMNPHQQAMAPYLGNQFQDPRLQHPLFNPGFGPNTMPYLGNGINNYNPFDPFNQNPFGSPYNQFGQNNPNIMPWLGNQNPNQWNPYGNPWGQNPYGPNGPGIMPYLGQNNPWGSPYGYNPYAPYGNPQYGIAPFMGNGSWLNNGAPSIMPYLGGGPGSPLAYANYPNMPYNNPFGAPFAPTPVQNFNWQMNQMRSYINYIGSGTYGSPPAILPMPSTPVFNTPGTIGNPVPRPTTPPPPAGGGAGGAPKLVPVR